MPPSSFAPGRETTILSSFLARIGHLSISRERFHRLFTSAREMQQGSAI
jgi:hypothetical protein